MQSVRKRRRRRRREENASSGSERESRAQLARNDRVIQVIDREREERLLRDPTAWERIGRELRIADPQRYVALMKVAEDICSIHRDPFGNSTASAFMHFAP